MNSKTFSKFAILIAIVLLLSACQPAEGAPPPKPIEIPSYVWWVSLMIFLSIVFSATRYTDLDFQTTVIGAWVISIFVFLSIWILPIGIFLVSFSLVYLGAKTFKELEEMRAKDPEDNWSVYDIWFKWVDEL